MSQIMSDVPSGWCWTTAKQACVHVVDCHNKTAPYSDRGIPLIRTSNIRDGKISLSHTKYVEQQTYIHWSRRCPPEPGDIIFTREAPMCEAGMVPPNTTLCMGQRMVLLRADNHHFLHKYLLYSVLGPHIKKYAKTVAVGTGVKHLRVRDVEELPIPLPPLNEQRRIVAKIEALQERSGRARKALEAIPPLLEKFRQSVLASAFRGDLTKDWREQHPDVEPASVLLERIRTERRKRWEEAELAKMKAKGKVPKDDGWKKKYKEPEPVDRSGLPELPEGWCWASAEELSNPERPVTYGILKPGPHVDGGVPMIRIVDVRSGVLNLSKTHLASTELSDQYHRTLLSGGEVLVSLVGSIGISAFVPNSAAGTNVHRNLAVIATGHYINGKILNYQIKGPLSQAYIRSVATGGNQPLFNLGDLRMLPLAVPPLCEQKEVERHIDSFENTYARARSLVEQSSIQASHLDQAILAKAFRGELVPQDPSDEPASVLLERIRAERDAAEALKKSKGKKPKKAKPQRKPSPRPTKAGKSKQDEAAGQLMKSLRTIAQAQLGDGASFGELEALAMETMDEARTAVSDSSRPRVFFSLANDDQVELVHQALLGLGALDRSLAMREVEGYLRDQGFVDDKTRGDGTTLDHVIARSIKAGMDEGRFDEPYVGYCRAILPNAKDYSPELWRRCVMEAIGDDGADGDETVRRVAEWARENMALEFKRLRKGGVIERGIREALEEMRTHPYRSPDHQRS